MKACACGCGQQIPIVDKKNRPRSFVPGHHNRLKDYSSVDMSRLRPFSFTKGHTPHNKGRPHLPGRSNPFYGKRHTEETRAKMRGPNNGNWRNGASRTNDLIRKSIEYLDWKVNVFVRDGRKCVLCGSGDRIEADHIKPFSVYPELRFDVANGRTLCHDCHRATPTYGNTRKTRVLD